MQTWRWQRCVEALKDYNDTDAYIKKIEEEMRVPHRETDINSDIKGTRTDNDVMFNTLWTIETHKAICQFRKQKQAIKELLEDSDEDTRLIIKELYIKRNPKYKFEGLVNSNLLHCGRTKAINKRKMFFKELDRKLDL